MAAENTADGVPNSSDLKLIYEALLYKTEHYNEMFDFYDGDHPSTFLTKRLKDMFKKIDVTFSENWCSVVVDSMLERINLKTISVVAPEARVQETSKRLMNALSLHLEAEDLHESVLVCGEGFIMVDRLPMAPEDIAGAIDAAELGDGAVNPQTEIYFNDPRLVHVVYRNDNPGRIRVGGKWWIDDRGFRRIKLYYDDHFEEWISTQPANKVRNYKSFRPITIDEGNGEEWWMENPYPLIPIFHFRTKRRKAISELKNAIPPQTSLNKLLNDMMASAEFAAFRQRYIITQADIGENLESTPGGIWELPAGDGMGEGTKVGEFSETNLTNFIEPINRAALTIATVTRTPKHYFVTNVAAPSGEALLTMEGPLNKKCQKRIDQFVPVWKNLWQFVMWLEGYPLSKDAIVPMYDKPETIQPLTQSSIRKTSRESGLPLKTVLRWEGLTTEQVEQVEEEIDAERERDLAHALRQQEVESAALGNAFERVVSGQAQGQTIQPADDEEEEEAFDG